MKSILEILDKCKIQSHKNGWLLSILDENIEPVLLKEFIKEMKDIGGQWKKGEGFVFQDEITLEEIKFMKEMKNLLIKYKGNICFTCGKNSDTHGLYDDGLALKIGDKTLVKTEGWYLGAGSL